MKRRMSSNDVVDVDDDDVHVDVLSLEVSASSDSDMEVSEGSVVSNATSPEEVLTRRAEMYQDYMKHVPIPQHRGSLIPFTSWTGLGRSIKLLYGQPLHYLTNKLLKQWDQLRIGSEDEYTPLDVTMHPSKAEATIWLVEEVHRRTTSHYHIASLWLSDPMHHSFVDAIFPPLENSY